MQEISQRELRNDSARIMRELEQGHSFVVNRNGRAVGELRPLRRERLVDTGVVLAMFADAPALDADRWRADLDVYADGDIDPRA